MLGKAAWFSAAPVLLAIVVLTAFLTVTSLKQVRDAAAQERQAAETQAVISAIVQEFTDMETGQRGYLLTDDTAYLQPYSDAKAKIGNDFAKLRAALTSRSAQERSLESQLQELAASKQAEMERTISLRERGFRLRAFRIVDTNEGKDYMDRARAVAGVLSLAENNRLLSLQKTASASLQRAFALTLLGNLGLLVIGALFFAVLRYDRKKHVKVADDMKDALETRDSQLRKLTFALSNQTHSNLNSIEAKAELLLQRYGGFLPREGYQFAEQIKEAAAQTEQLRKELLSQPASAA